MQKDLLPEHAPVRWPAGKDARNKTTHWFQGTVIRHNQAVGLVRIKPDDLYGGILGSVCFALDEEVEVLPAT